jgi:hypothetical protein
MVQLLCWTVHAALIVAVHTVSGAAGVEHVKNAAVLENAACKAGKAACVALLPAGTMAWRTSVEDVLPITDYRLPK